ncbi:MAG: hypothetical protein KTR30_16495 [Saprospiraceae bacterium]|nr:hypothetical protein [Saprospiraceae bacterium]
MKKLLILLVIGLGTWQAGQAQTAPEDFKWEMDSFQKEMMKMLEQFGFQEGAPGMRIDTMMIQPFGLFPGMGMDSLNNQDFMKQWQSLSEQLMKSFQGEEGMNGFGEFFKNFPGFDPESFPTPGDQKPSEEGTKPKKKRKIYKI